MQTVRMPKTQTPEAAAMEHDPLVLFEAYESQARHTQGTNQTHSISTLLVYGVLISPIAYKAGKPGYISALCQALSMNQKPEPLPY